MWKALKFRQNLAAWIVAGYGILLLAHLGVATFSKGEKSRERRGFEIEHILRVSRPLLRESHEKDLIRYLKDAYTTGFIDYFELSSSKRVEKVGSAPSAPLLTESLNEIDGWIWGKAESAELSLRVASGFGWKSRLSSAWAIERTRLPADVVFLFFAMFLGLFFQGKMRRQVAHSLVEAGLRVDNKKQKSKTEPVQKVSKGDSFEGICGRIILTNVEELIRAGGKEEISAALEGFFSDAAALLERYRGNLFGAYGQEVLFSFSEKDSEKEARLALASARDLEKLAERSGIKIGCAFSRGQLYSTSFATGFILLGSPVEETTELCRRIREEGGGILLTEEIAQAARYHATFNKVSTPERFLFFLSQLPDPSQAILESLRNGNYAELAFHRGDSALELFLNTLADSSGWDRETYVGVVNALRSTPLSRCGDPVVHAYRNLLRKEIEVRDSYRLSSVVALATSLLQKSQVDRAMEKMFFQALALKDRRVQANILEFFTRFFPDREIPELKPMIRDGDNRVSANALIKAACERFDEKVILRIEERVRGGSVAHVASALHAMGEIALYYRKHDPLYLGTKISFLRLFEGIPAWAEHPNLMIRRQALIAAQKLGSEPLEGCLRDLFLSSDDPELLELFASLYGWRKNYQKAAA